MSVIKTDWAHEPLGDEAIAKVDLFSDGDCEVTLMKNGGDDRLTVRRPAPDILTTLRRLTDRVARHVVEVKS